MNKLILVATKEQFDELIKSNNLYNNSIIFVQNTKEIWTHGTCYTGETYYSYTSPDDFNLTTDWNKLLDLDELTEEGSYLIQMKYGGLLYSGIFSFSALLNSSINGFVGEEIPLHTSGFNQEYPRIFLKIGLTLKNNTYKEALFIAADSSRNNASITLKIKKLL